MPLATNSVLLVFVSAGLLVGAESSGPTYFMMMATTNTAQLRPHVTPSQDFTLPWKVNPATAPQKTTSRQLMIACAL